MRHALFPLLLLALSTCGAYDLFAARIGNDAVSGIAGTSPMLALRAWPNPCADAIYLAGMPIGTHTLELFDGTGRRIWTQDIRGTEATPFRLNLPSTLAPGVYTLLLHAAGSRTAVRLVHH